MKTYKHRPLKEPDADTYELRFLTLLKGNHGDQLHARIECQTFMGGITGQKLNPTKQWQALSYTWGRSDQPMRNLLIETELEEENLEIRENLHSALQHLRSARLDTRLWIDAVCMDQSDSQQSKLEQSWQIHVMHDIYSAAERVIIWLGGAAEDSDFAIAFLRDLGQTFKFDPITYEAEMSDNAPKRILELHNDWNEFAWNTREHRSVCALFHRSWFSRVWIRQEIFAASDASFVVCGHASIHLTDFRNAIQYLAVRGLDVRGPSWDADHARLGLVVVVCQRAFANISNILDRIRTSECTRSQDKIYGCLGMIKIASGPEFASQLPTDYPPTPELYQKLFITFFEHYNSISLLKDAGTCQRSSLGGPSWLPDWLVDFTKLDLSIECAASHGMRPEAGLVAPGIFSIKGCFAAEIVQVDRLRSVTDLSSDNFAHAYAELSRFMRTHLKIENIKQMEGFVRALTCPLNGLRVPLEHLEQTRRDILELAKAAMCPDRFRHDLDERVSSPDSVFKFQICIRAFIQQKLPFIFTEDGNVGIGADTVESGDLVAAVLGSTNLFILRPAERDPALRRRYHQLIGSCYLHGYNWGEALLGPLPANFTVVPRLDENRGVYRPYYLDTVTEQATFWDPRISWDLLTPKPQESAWTINAPAGLSRRKVPTSEYFMSQHGTRLVEIYLQ